MTGGLNIGKEGISGGKSTCKNGKKALGGGGKAIMKNLLFLLHLQIQKHLGL